MPPRRRSNRIRKPDVNILFTTTGKRHRRRVLLRWGLLALAVCVTLTAAGIGTHLAVDSFLRHALYQNPRYALKQIVVEVKGSVPRKQVVQATRLVLGQNTMSVDLVEVEHNVEKLPYVAEAQVRRQLPDKIVVRITERMPIARIVSTRQDIAMQESFYIDRDGVTIKLQPNEIPRNLPEIVGDRLVDIEAGQRIDLPEIQAAVTLLKLIELTPLRTQFDIARIDMNRPLAMELQTRDGARIVFQLDNLPRQLDRLQQILDFANNRDRQLATVDLTPERNVPVRFKN
jgi:cell division protein FtsQ